MKAKNILTIVMMLTLVAAFGFLAQGAPASAQVTADEAAAETAVKNLFGVSETDLYIVLFAEPSLAEYRGGIAGLEATSPQATGERRLDANSPAAQAYTDYLTQQHNQFTANMEQTLGRSVEVTFDYTAALNGMAVAVSHEEAAQIAAMPGVAAVYGDTIRELDTDVGPLLIGAPAVWNGDTSSGVATRGEGVIIGVIDSGINSAHPSFAATDGDGYVHTNPYGAGVYKGWCATNPGFCNEKLIAAYGLNPVGASPEDTDGHGSHTASTAGGNAHIASFNVGNDPYNIPIQGVAPRANIVAYKVCNPGCPSSASVAAVNSAIAEDMVDVLNYSISGSDNPWNDPTDLAFLNASNAGIFVSASAGNQGPGASTVAKTGPWNASVAASTHNRAIGQTLDVTSQGEPAALQDLFVVPAEGTNIATDINSGIRYDPTNNLGCTPFAPGTFTGNLALIQRGECTFAVKATNAQNAGATGVVLFQSVGGPPITAGGNPAPPMVMLDLESGIALRDHVLANPTTTTVRINASTSLVYVDAWEDIVAGFSSRGPSQFELLKPDYIAPGVNILAAVEVQSGDPVQYGFLQGTSMSSPHGAGAAALMIALHSTWSPAEVKSALATTAVGGLFKEDGLTLADPFDVGSGRLDLSLASTVGLVFHETGANYAAANPAIGGDPKTLNQPSVVNYSCVGECSWTRTVKSVVNASATYTATVSGPAGLDITVTPSTFTIAPGATQQLVITADVTGLPVGDFAFGSVVLETDATHTEGGFGDFVELHEAYDRADAWAQKTGDLSPYAGQDVCLAFRLEGSDSHSWRIDDILVSSDAGSHLDESFTDETFPPTGWSYYQFGTNPQHSWVRTLTTPNTAPAAAFYNWNLSSNHDDGWLVTPQFTLGDNPVFTYFDRTGFLSFYKYSGVWISTGSCDPTPQASVEVADTNIPVVVRPASAILPESVSIETMYRTGSTEVTGLLVGDEITDLTVEVGGLFAADMTTEELMQDPTNGNPYNNDGGTFFVTVDVPAGAMRLLAEITASEAPDMDLFVGTGSTPSAGTEVCASLTPSWDEFCAIDNPTAGTWWVLVQNWQGSASQPDEVTLAVAVISDSDEGNMTVDGPATVPPGAAFDVTVNWDEPALVAGEKWYGFFTLGTDAGDPGNIGMIWVDLLYLGAPSAAVAPEVSNYQPGDTVFTGTLTIANVGDAPLSWNVVEQSPAAATAPVTGPAALPDVADLRGLTATSTAPAVAAAPRAAQSTVLYEQVQNGNSGIVSDYSTVQAGGAGAYSASDFVLAEGATIEYIFTPGFDNTNTLANQPAISWAIYANASGVPAGHPEDGTNMASALWSHSDAPNGAGVDITGNNIALDLIAAGEAFYLPAGTYWLTVYPTYNNNITGAADARWNWFQAAQVGQQTHLVAPLLFGGVTNWTPLGSLGVTFFDTAFRLEGTVGQVCDPGDIPWLSLPVTSGMLAGGETAMVDVVFDSAGLADGVYTGQLCVTTNDPMNPTTFVDVELTVGEFAQVQVAHLAPFAMDPGTAVTVTLNGAPALTDFAYGDSTGYIPLPPGSYDLEVFPGSSVTPAMTATVTLDAGVDYTVLATGDGVNQPLALVALVDDNTPPTAGNFKLRLGHLAPFAAGDATADIRLQDGTPVLTDVVYSAVTGYLELPAGAYDLKITTPGGDTTLIDPIEVTFNEGDIVSAFATGDGTNQPLGAFALPSGSPGFFLPLFEGYTLFLPVIFK